MKNFGLCVVATSLLVMIGCSGKEGYVSRGNKLFSEGKYAEASINYRKAIQKDSQYGEAYYRLGLSAIKQDQSRLAYDSLFRAMQLLPERVDAKEKFAEVCLAYYLASSQPNYYKLLVQISDELLVKNPNSFKGLEVKAYLASTDRKPQEAIALFRRALEIDASDPALTGALAQNLYRNGQAQEAEQVALNLMNRQKSYGPIYDLLYQQYVNSGRVTQAESILRTKVNNNPKNADYFVQLAAHYDRQRQPVEMKATLQRLLDDPKDFPRAPLWVGDFYMGLRDPSTATRYYEEGIKNNAKNKILYQKRTADALVVQGKYDDAFQMAEQILKEDPNEHEALRVHANLLLRTGKADSVAKAEQEFLTLSKATPEDATVRFGLGEAKRLKGDLEGAREQYLEALGKQKNYLLPRYELAEVGLMSQRPQEALQQANEILKVRPDDNRARLLHARGLLETGNLSAARDELNAMAKVSPHDPQLQFGLGLIALAGRKYAEAKAIFAKLDESGDARGVVGLSEAYLDERQFEKAFSILQGGVRKYPDSPLVHEQFAKAAALNGQYDLAVTEYQKLIAADPESLGKRLRLAEVYERKGDHNNAFGAYQKAEQLSPTDVQAAVGVAEALAQAGRTGEAKTQYEKVIRLHPENPGALNNAAFFLSETGGDLDEALKLIQRALEKVPGQPGFSDTLGYIYLKKGQRDSAIRTFTTLARKYPGFATFRYHLGLALLENGDKAGAKKELEAALADHPAEQDLRRIKELLDKIG